MTADENKLNIEQQTAVDFPFGGRAVVTASAGSGKTFTLSKKVAGIISDPKNDVPVDALAVLTFTKNAAKSLREKIIKALNEQMSAAAENGDTERAAYLSDQQARLRNAYISTIDAFCIRIIRENPEAFDLSVNFTIADAPKLAAMQQQAMKAALSEFYSEKAGFTAEERNALFYTFDFEDDRELQERVFDVCGTLSSFADAEGFLDRNLELSADSGKMYEKYFPSVKPYLEQLRETIVSLLNLYDDVLENLPSEIDELKSSGKTSKSDDNAEILLQNITGYIALDRNRFDKIITALDETVEKNDPQILKKALDVCADDTQAIAEAGFDFRKGPKVQHKNTFITTKNDLSAVSKELAELNFDTSDEAAERNALAVGAFTKLVRSYRKKFGEIKSEQAAAEFSDCEIKLLEKLKNDSAFRQGLSSRFKCVIVDEFQDCNDIQAEIFKLLGEHGGLFYVGDIKQSIYAFRGGNPNIMMKLCSGEDGFSALPMYNNYRSRDTVTKTVNSAFSGLMTRHFGGVDYTDENGLRAARRFPENDLSDEEAAANITPEQKRLYENLDGKFKSEAVFLSAKKSEDDKEIAEARYVAHRIRQMMEDENFYVLKDDKYVRPVLSDFAILMRNKKEIPLYREALAEQGFSSAAPRGQSFLESEEISLILNYLSVVDDPLRNEETLKVMMSPIYRFTSEEMAAVRLGVLGLDTDKLSDSEIQKIYEDKESGLKTKSLYSCAKYCRANSKSENGVPTPKLDNFLDDIENFRKFVYTNSIYELICKIYEETDAVSVVASFEDSSKRVANVRRLCELAADFEARAGGSVGDFLRFIERAKASGRGAVEEASAPDAAGNSVRIMTFHGSKGLEAPVCFLVGLDKTMNNSDYTGKFLMNREYGFAFETVNVKKRVKTRSFAYVALKRICREKMCGEELRLLYVAMTRAMDKLIMVTDSGLYSSQKKPNDWSGSLPEKAENVFNGSIPFRWIIKSLNRLKKSDVPEFENDFFRMYEDDFSGKKPELPDEDTENIEQEISEEETARLKKAMSFEYGFTADTVRQAKFSVTEIAHRGSVPPVNLTKPDFAAEKKLSGAEKGNAYHGLMEQLALERFRDTQSERYEDIISEEISRLHDEALLSEEACDTIEPKLAAEFLRSELGERLLRSEFHREVPFYSEMDGKIFGEETLGEIAVQGRIDLYFEESDGLVIVDYKSDSIPNLERERENYAKQVRIYCAALSEMTGKKVKEAYLYAFLAGKAVRVL